MSDARRLSRRVFRKEGPASRAGMYAAEFEGLLALRAAGVNAPEPYLFGTTFIEMRALDLGAPDDWAAMARMLARLHRTPGPRFGWGSDNWIGLSPQKNGWKEDWAEFFWEFRLLPQLERAGLTGDGFFLAQRMKQLLEQHQPSPSLLHGDLWGGNVGFTPQGPVIFDPAVYFGDREADIAMTELFGGFPESFYRAYDEELPLDAGYDTRKHLYNLYHLLNHLNLFGHGYLPQVKATLARLGAST